MIEKIMVWVIALYYGVVVLYDILKKCIHLGPRKVFTWKKRERSACLDDPKLGTHGYLHLEDVRIHYVASGPEDKPLMLFLHGFPEFWFSWRFQIQEFQRDYRVVAIDMRGYGDSDKPEGKDAYSMKKLLSDVKQVILALGYKSCILVGHDWGGAIAWIFGAEFPDMTDKIIIMNAPILTVFKKTISNYPIQRKMSWYTVFFLMPYLPELFFKVNDYSTLDSTFDDQNELFSFSTTFQKPMTKEEMEAYKYTFSQPGALTPAINYYRAALKEKNEHNTKYTMPVLLVWGIKDLCLCPQVLDVMEKDIPNITVKRVPEASHFVQMDTPDVVNKIMRDWLGD